MKKSTLCVMLGTVLSLWGSQGAFAQDDGQEPFYKITTQDEFNQCTFKNDRYDRDNAWAWYPYSGGFIRLWYSSSYSSHYLEDYIISPEQALQAGKLYRITCKPAAYGSKTTTDLTFLYGQGDDETAYTVIKKLSNLPYASNASSASNAVIDFAVPADGNYHIAILGDKEFAKIWDFKVYALGESAIPNKPSDFQITPDANGQASAVISFTLPATTITGQAIQGDLTYNIMRGGESVNTGTGTPGAAVSWTDTTVPEGSATYSVTVTSGENTTEPVEATTFIGYETPQAPTAAAFTSDGDTRTVTWEAPTTGIHGIALDPALLSYTVTRCTGADEEEVASGLKATTFSDTYAASSPVNLSYKIVAVNGTKSSAEAATPTIKIGHIDLPFSDSFAGASLGAVWDSEVVTGTSATNKWEAKSIASAGRYDDSISPTDNDGGFAFYNSYNINRNNEARLTSAPISKSSSSAPYVEFMFHHDTGSSSSNDRIVVEVSSDNGEWVAVGDSEIKRYSETEGWVKYMFPLSDAISADCSTYRVGFHAISGYGNNMALDAVRIFNLVDNDIALSVAAPAKVVAGAEAKLIITLANQGNVAIPADSYSLDVFSTLPTQLEAPASVDLGALEVKTFEVAFTPSALDIADLESVDFSVEAVYANDADPDNNSATASAPTAYAEHAAVEHLSLEPAEGAFNLSWDAAGDPDYEPFNYSEDFEGFEDGATGEFNGFKSYDFDESAGSSYYAVTGKSEFSVFTVEPFQASSVKVNGVNGLGVTVGNGVQQDDWLISPALAADPVSTIDFSFNMGTPTPTQKFEVRYATTEYDPASPMKAFTELVDTQISSTYSSSTVQSDGKLYKLSYSLPATAKYVAIHMITNKSSYQNVVWLDDIAVVENNPAPLLGYNIYQKGIGRLNSEVIPKTELQYAITELNMPMDGSAPTFFVTAVYPDGESAPSPVAVIEMPKAPVNLTAEHTGHDIYTGQNDLTISWEAPEDATESTLYYVSLNGIEVAETDQLQYVARNVASKTHWIEVYASRDGLSSESVMTSVTVSDDDYAKASFTLSSNNGFIPAGVKLAIAPAEGEAIELPFADDNTAEIGFLPRGSYAVSCSAEGYEDFSANLDLQADTETPVELQEVIVAPYDLAITAQEAESGLVPFLLTWNTSGETNMYRVIDYSVTLDGAPYGENTTDTQMLIENADTSSHTAGVKANYASGSSTESTIVFQGVSGLGGASIIVTQVTGLEGAIRVSVSGNAAVEIFNAAGQSVASVNLADETLLIPAAQGIYVARVAGRSFKVAVR